MTGSADRTTGSNESVSDQDGPGTEQRTSATQRHGSLRWLVRALGALAPVSLIVLLGYGLVSENPTTTIDDQLARDHVARAPSYRLAVLQTGRLGPRLTARLAPALADRSVTSTELRGHPYVLNFWASWCVPCRGEAPVLESTWRGARPRGVLFVGLDMQDVTEDARTFTRHFNIDYLNIRDPTNDVARHYGATGVPETFFISARGDVVNHVIGVVSTAQLQAGIAAAVAGRPHAARQGGAQRPTR